MCAGGADVAALSLRFPGSLPYGLIAEPGTAAIAEVVQGTEHCAGRGDLNRNHKTTAPSGREKVFKPQKAPLAEVQASPIGRGVRTDS